MLVTHGSEIRNFILVKYHLAQTHTYVVSISSWRHLVSVTQVRNVTKRNITWWQRFTETFPAIQKIDFTVMKKTVLVRRQSGYYPLQFCLTVTSFWSDTWFQCPSHVFNAIQCNYKSRVHHKDCYIFSAMISIGKLETFKDFQENGPYRHPYTLSNRDFNGSTSRTLSVVCTCILAVQHTRY